MRIKLAAILFIAGCFVLSLAQTPRDKRVEPPKKEAEKEQEQATLVDFDADVTLSRGDDIIRFVGNVLFHHNGAIIQCDSMFKYDEYRAEFFGKVLISQDSTYIYGDRVYYDGRTSVADVYAPIVKMTRGDVTLYTYNLSFNTKSQVGTFSGGGVITQRENLMESTRGEYNSGVNTVKFMDSVALRSDTYEIRTDSLSYNLDTEVATFLARAYIWDRERDFLMADRGDYHAKDSTYVFTHDAYVMTQDKEMWADTIRYNSSLKQAYMFSNAQILDTVNCTLMFGDWGYYDDSLGMATMTLTPSVRGWQRPDTTARYDSLGRQLPPPKIDTTYMRADSIRLFTFEPGKSKEGVQRKIPTLDTVAVKVPIVVSIDTLVRMDTIKMYDTIRLARDTINAADTTQTLDTIPIGDNITIRDTIVFKERTVYDTTFTYRDTIEIRRGEVLDTVEKERVVRAFHHVRIWNEGYQAVCDSTVSFSVDSMAVMHIDPILWNENNQITSDQIDIYSLNEELDWADFTGEPFITQQALTGDTAHFNQARGKRLKAFFKNNDIDNALLSGNVENLYYKDEGGRLETLASITCAELNIIFFEREPSKMIWGGSGEGVIYPIEKIPASQPLFLEGYSWHEDIRPKGPWEICRRVERPSIRAEAEGYYKPTFAINAQINESKTRLTAEGVWSDRTELPSVTPDYFQSSDFLF